MLWLWFCTISSTCSVEYIWEVKLFHKETTPYKSLWRYSSWYTCISEFFLCFSWKLLELKYGDSAGKWRVLPGRCPVYCEYAAQSFLQVNGTCPAFPREPILLGLQRVIIQFVCRKAGVTQRIRYGSCSCCPNEQQPETVLSGSKMFLPVLPQAVA